MFHAGPEGLQALSFLPSQVTSSRGVEQASLLVRGLLSSVLGCVTFEFTRAFTAPMKRKNIRGTRRCVSQLKLG